MAPSQIIIVEDSESVRGMLERVLAIYFPDGTVWPFASFGAFQSFVRKRADPHLQYDTLITDHDLESGRTGRDVLEELIPCTPPELLPTKRLVLISGNAREDPRIQKLLDDWPTVVFCQKPCKTEVLLAALTSERSE